MQGPDASSLSIEPNSPLPYSTLPVPMLKDARPAGWVNCVSICASTMPRAQKQGSKRFNSQGRRNTLPIWVNNLSMGRGKEIL